MAELALREGGKIDYHTCPSPKVRHEVASITVKSVLQGFTRLALQIERRDLDGVVSPFTIGASTNPEDNFSQEVVLFDNVPGGAGHVRQIAEKFEQVLKRALEVADCGECAEDTSCLNCLRNYGNQIYWEELKRGPVARFLEAVIHQTFPSNLDHIAPGAAHVAAIDKPRWLSQQLLATEQEVLIAAPSVTRERPQGITQNWLEMIQDLLRRGVKVSLLLTDLPPADRARPDAAGLRNHLSLLMSDGLRLYFAENGKLPEWSLVIDPSGMRCRAVFINGADRFLNSQIGADGLVTTLDPAAVGAIAESMRGIPCRVVKPEELEFPPNVRVVHIRDGERVKEADLFGDVFRSHLKSLLISDRYLRSNHHEKRLRAYLTLINGQPGMRPQVTIGTLAAEVKLSLHSSYYQTSAEQRQMFARIINDFPALDIQYRLERSLQSLPHDRFIHLTRADGTEARIGIGFFRTFDESRHCAPLSRTNSGAGLIAVEVFIEIAREPRNPQLMGVMSVMGAELHPIGTWVTHMTDQPWNQSPRPNVSDEMRADPDLYRRLRSLGTSLAHLTD
jgi:uncharacterized protein DUF1998